MTTAANSDKPNILWLFFSSVKLALVILILLAVVSILGTVIPQRESAMEFARGLSPGVFRLYSILGLFDLYHAAWFRVLLGSLALNLAVCSIDRFPSAWKRIKARPKLDRGRLFDNVPPEHSFVSAEAVESAAPRVAGYLRGRFRTLREQSGPDAAVFLGEKGRYAHFGVYLVHLSVLTILVGALVGSFFGFEAFVNIVEGDQTDKVRLRDSSGRLKLGFDLRCDKFFVDFYENGSPKEYRSDLSFIVNGKTVARASALVNHPVHFNGITFYQASYGKVAAGKVGLTISRDSADPGTVHVEAEPGKPLALPGNDGNFTILDARGDFMRMGPAALLSVRSGGGEETQFWVFKEWRRIEQQFPGFSRQFPKFNPSAFKPYTFYLDNLENRYYTGLQVNRDPGVDIVWLGCFLMVAGFMVTFFTSHRRIWVRLSRDPAGTSVAVAGMSSKNPVGLHREMERLAADMRRLLEEKGH